MNWLLSPRWKNGYKNTPFFVNWDSVCSYTFLCTVGVVKVTIIRIIMPVYKLTSSEHKPIPPTCEEAAVVLLYFLRCLKLLPGMFLRQFIPQVQRVLLLSEETSALSACYKTSFQTLKVSDSWCQHVNKTVTISIFCITKNLQTCL